MVLMVPTVRCEIGHINDVPAQTWTLGRESSAERSFKPPLKWTEQKIDRDDCADDEDDFGERHNPQL
jgi:hypothetical protein